MAYLFLRVGKPEKALPLLDLLKQLKYADDYDILAQAYACQQLGELEKCEQLLTEANGVEKSENIQRLHMLISLIDKANTDAARQTSVADH